MTKEIEFLESFGHILAYQLDRPQALRLVVPELPQEHFLALKTWWEQSSQETFIYIADFYISPELRNRGLGRELIERFLKAYEGTILLFAGSFDTPTGLDLVSFYESYDFYIIEPLDFPLMIREAI